MTPSLTRTNERVTTEQGITASTTQTQGEQPLTSTINEVSVVANASDVVTMPSAVAGRSCFVLNDGANNLQVFPASGDTIGSGVDVSQIIEPNESSEYVCYGDGFWHLAASTEILHAEMHDQDNTDAFVISAATEDTLYHTNGLASGDLLGWTFDAGGGGTSFPIASIADGADSGVDIAVTTTGSHGMAVGDIVSHTNLADSAYVGVFVVKAVISVTVYEVAAVFTATGTGTMDQAAVLTANAGSAGVHHVIWAASATNATNNETFDFAIYLNDTIITGSKMRRKFGTANDFGSMSGVAIVAVADGDKISFAVNNEDSAGNITIRNLTLCLSRL